MGTNQTAADRFEVHAHIPRGSADAIWHILDMQSDNHDTVAIVDPHCIYGDAYALACSICGAMNAAQIQPEPLSC